MPDRSTLERTQADETGSIEVRDVTVHLGPSGSVHVLDDVSLHVRPGEFVCFIGPSGCGKSTLLNVLGGFLQPARGSVSLGGCKNDDRSLKRAVVFQEYALFPWLSAQRNVEFGLKSRGVKEGRRDKALQYLSAVGLEKFAHAHPHELSGGMQQRVAIARALACEPDYLLMDEPLGALDALTRDQIQELISQLWTDFRHTVIYVTHNVLEAVYLGDRVVVFTPGPGRIREVVNVDLPRPRRRADPEFVQIAEHITNQVRLRNDS